MESLVVYLHDAVPIVARSNAKQRQKRDAEVLEVGVSVESFARVFLRTLCQKTPTFKIIILEKKIRTPVQPIVSLFRQQPHEQTIECQMTKSQCQK